MNYPIRQSQFAMHLAIQAREVTASVKNPIRIPIITAPKILVAANVIARSIIENNIVPRSPHKRAVRELHTQEVAPVAFAI